MSKLFFITISMILSFIISGCQAKPEQQQDTVQLTSPANQSSINVINKPLCKKSYSPPIKDVDKLKTMLLKSGKITSEMSDEEVRAAINKYIQNKRAAFNKCNK